jgi:Protein of unknown function (DUF2726)
VRDETIDRWFIGLVVILLALLFWRIVAAGFRKTNPSGPFYLPPGVTLNPQALLTDAELLLYNLIRIAVQDRYLVFAQVPLWSFLSVEAEDQSRVQVLRHLALRRADFVLVHPGSRMVEQVVQLEGDPSNGSDRKAQHHEVQRIVQGAGIRFTTLGAQPNYTVQELQRLLDISESE